MSHPILLEYYKKYQGGDPLQIPNDKPINKIPSLIKVDVKLYDPSSKGGRSKDIIPIIENEYNLGNHNFKNNDPESNINVDFTIVKSIDKILYGAGSFTAVYKIKDNNKTINDPNVEDNIYILRLTIQDNNTHMYDNPKIHKEYKLFNNYLPKIYYYGILYANDSKMTFNYTITKLYYDFSIDENTNQIIIPPILSNKDKFVFLYNNIVMLNDLNQYNYIHFDYKIQNIGFEIENDDIKVILIDYDEKTLQELSSDNPNFKLDENTGYIYFENITYTPALIPQWIEKVKKIGYFAKFANAALLNIIFDLDIDFKINEYNINIFDDEDYLDELINCKFDKNLENYTIKLQELTYSDPLQLNSDKYKLTPSYKFLVKLFSPIMENLDKYVE